MVRKPIGSRTVSILAGFHGEYYGLTDKNPFDESMHAIARIQELFGGEGVQIRVAPKLDRDGPAH